MKSILRLCLALVFLCWHAAMSHAATNLGLFTDHTDVGTVAQAGTVQYQPADGVYQVTGGGENINRVWKIGVGVSFCGTPVGAGATGDSFELAGVQFEAKPSTSTTQFPNGIISPKNLATV